MNLFDRYDCLHVTTDSTVCLCVSDRYSYSVATLHVARNVCIYLTHTIVCIWRQILQPTAFAMSFNINLHFHSHWSLFNGTWQKRPREQDPRLRFEKEETALQIQEAVLCVWVWYVRDGFYYRVATCHVGGHVCIYLIGTFVYVWL